MLLGKAASPGIALGKVLILKKEQVVIEEKKVVDFEGEKNKFMEAIQKSKEELSKIKEKTEKEVGAHEAEIFEAHLMVLEDPELIDSTVSKIEEGVNAEFALKQVADQFVMIFESMDNEYMRERAADIKDVSGRVINHILGVENTDLGALSEEIILVADDLTPSETASMNKDKVLGFLTNIGGKTSHTAIMARTLEIPAVVGMGNVTESVKDGDFVVFNGDCGQVIVNPSEDVIKEYEELKVAYEKQKKELETLKGQKSETLDGRHVELVGNIGTPEDVEGLIKFDAEGVGLYRTEFMYMDRPTFPTEDEQFEGYKKVLEGMKGKPVVIRTLDIGGDKKLDYLDIGEEMNPFLGYRAIRLCLNETEIFKTQLRALLRASVHGNLKIMFPMISSLAELLKAKAILNECKEELVKEGVAVSDNIEVGMMIEIPAAAIISDILAKHVDFFSIGTNDLIQYTTAVDRMNENINDLYNPYHPAVLRLIKMVIDNSHKAGIWTGMCGEMAGDPNVVPVLLGMGLDEFSMSPASILGARKIIREMKFEDAKKLADHILSLTTDEEIREALKINE